MPTIRERAKADGTRIFHVQVRMSGFPARTASFPTRRRCWQRQHPAGLDILPRTLHW